MGGLHNAAPTAVQMITGECSIALNSRQPSAPHPPGSRKAGIGARQTRRYCRKGPISVAQRVVVTLSDDIDGGAAAETVTFALDGKSYEIDLNTSNAKKLRKALAPYMAAGRKQTNMRQARQDPRVVPAHFARSRPGGRARLGPLAPDGGTGPRPDPQEGLRGVPRSELTHRQGPRHPLGRHPADTDLRYTPAGRLKSGARRGARPKSRTPRSVRV